MRKEEGEKLELKIRRMIQLEEEKLMSKSCSKRTKKRATPELIFDDENDEDQANLRDMIHELQKKVSKDSGFEIGETLTRFSHSLEAIPRQKNIKHFNFESIDGIGDPEEHRNYFEQIASINYYNDLTKCKFFASTFK